MNSRPLGGVRFTPMHLTMLVEAYTGSPSSYQPTPTRTEYIYDLIKQGLVFKPMHAPNPEFIIATAYGERKIEELLKAMQLPGLQRIDS